MERAAQQGSDPDPSGVAAFGAWAPAELGALLDAAFDPAVLLEATAVPPEIADLKVTQLNRAAAALAAQPAPGASVGDAFPALAPILLPQARQALLAEGEDRAEGGEVVVHTVEDGWLPPRRLEVRVARVTPVAVVVSWRDADRARGAAEHHEALLAAGRQVQLLQQVFLPRALPSVPGVALASRYRSAEGAGALGGDWYDAMTAADGTVVLCVGDVAGHGLAAVEIMGVARITARAYAAEDPAPERLLDRLGRYAVMRSDELDHLLLVTLLAARYDPRARRLVWASAGHPPPLVIDGKGARFLPTRPGPPLGSVEDAGRCPAHEALLEPGATVVLYSDGLVERRGEHIDAGLERLLRAATDLSAEPGEACEQLIERCVAPTAEDDVCLLTLRVR